MKLKQNQQYLSITNFAPVELPDFTVLTGGNGAGKTHLLEAISKGNVVVDGINVSRII